MLTKRENFIETIRGGNPDRYVNNYEYLSMFFDPTSARITPRPEPGGTSVSAWGVTNYLEPLTMGMMPIHTEGLVAIPDITVWQDVIKRPRLQYPDDVWEDFNTRVAAVDRNETFVAPMIITGIFEKLHFLMGMEDAMVNFYEEPEAMHDLIDFLGDWEVEQAEQIVKNIHPDAVFHHDDWGSQRNSFLPPEVFNEFITPVYKRIYGFWKENGVEIVVHHSDCYCANLVDYMIDMGIDVWQGVVRENDAPALVEKYGGKITFMGGLNNGIYDNPDTTQEQIEAGLREILDAMPNNGKHFFIPGLTMGGANSIFDGVYDKMTAAIDNMSKIYF